MDDPLLASYRSAQVAALHARAAEIHESSADRLRANGRDQAAKRVERFAALARDRIDHPVTVARVYSLARGLRRTSGLGELLDEALEGTIALLAADFGNIQLVDPGTRTLRIVAQRGFGDEFLDYFAVVDDDRSACGLAAAAHAQTVVADVATDPLFAAHRAIAEASGFRAVQSTPLMDERGVALGVLSTHFRRPHRPDPHELRLTEAFASLVTGRLARMVAVR